MSDVIVIGVAGGTGSGKTTLVKALMNRFGDNISVLSHDNYYKRHDEMSYEERTHLNYDCPDAFDTDMMIEHLRMLKNGQAIDCPTYDYTIHNPVSVPIFTYHHQLICPRKDGREYSTLESHKSISYQIATEW